MMEKVFEAILYRKNDKWFIKLRLNDGEWHERPDRKRLRYYGPALFMKSRELYPKEMFDLACEDFRLPQFAGYLINLSVERGHNRYYRKTIDRTAEV